MSSSQYPTAYSQAVALASNQTQTLLQREALDEAKLNLNSMLCTFTTNLQKDEDLTKETRGYRDAVAEKLTSLLGLLNEIAFAHVEAARAIRQILAQDITNPAQTTEVDKHINKAIAALGKASTGLLRLEKDFARHRTELGLASEQTPGMWRSIGNFCHDYNVFNAAALLSTVASATGSVLRIVPNLENGVAAAAAVGVVGSFLAFEKYVSKKCSDSAAFPKLEKNKDAILTVAASINELLEVLAVIHQTWKDMEETRLTKKYKSSRTNVIKSTQLSSISDALETHAGGLRELLDILRPKVALVKEGLKRKDIEAPRRLLTGSMYPKPANPPPVGRSNRLRRDPRFLEAIEALGNLNNV